MKKTLLTLATLFLLSGNAFAQLADEIISYVDSTEILVKNGRRLILKELNDNNIVKVKEIYDYLTAETKDEPYSSFYFIEDFYINLLSGDWERVNTLMMDYEENKNKVVYPNSQDLIRKLYETTLKNSRQIVLNCNNSPMNEQAKRLVDIFITYIDHEDSDRDYNKKLDSYKRDFKNQEYKSFEKGFLPDKTIKASWNFSFGSGMIFTTKDLSKNFSNNASGNMAMDLNLGKVFTSLYMQGTSLKLKEPFTAVSATDTLVFKMNDKFSYMDVGLKGGYFIIRSDRFHLAPYVSVSGSFLESTKYDASEQDSPEYEFFNSFTYGAGIHTEFKLLEFDYPDIYGYTKGYFSIKLEAGYNKIHKFKDSYAKGDTPYIVCALVMGFGQF